MDIKRNGKYIGPIMLVLTVLIAVSAVTYVSLSLTSSEPSAKIGILDINGPLAWKHAQLAEKAERDSSIRAVVLRINSPGGSVTDSFQIENSISTLATKKTVVSDLEKYATSGAYLVSSAADYIYAHSRTTTGSLGVVATWVSYKDYYENLGIDHHIWKSGDQKGMFATYRGPTKEENAKIKEIVDQYTYELFNRIMINRPESTESLDNLRNGMTITGDEALEHGLVDNIGNFGDAVNKAAQLENLKEYRKVELSEYYSGD